MFVKYSYVTATQPGVFIENFKVQISYVVKHIAFLG